jgi:hypothetical protein
MPQGAEAVVQIVVGGPRHYSQRRRRRFFQVTAPRPRTPRLGSPLQISARAVHLPLWAARPTIKQVNDPLQLGPGVRGTTVEHRRETVVKRRT